MTYFIDMFSPKTYEAFTRSTQGRHAAMRRGRHPTRLRRAWFQRNHFGALAELVEVVRPARCGRYCKFFRD